jgi:hypothetical protein
MYSTNGAYPEQDELFLVFKFFLSKLIEFEIIGIKLRGSNIELGWSRNV